MLISPRHLTAASPPPDREEWAYFAGLLDGEGSVTLVRVTPRNYAARVTMTNTDLPLLTWVHDRFRGARLYLFDQPSCVKNQNAKPIYRLDWTGRAVLPLLIAVRPYLRLKTKQADEVLAFLQHYQRVHDARKPYERLSDSHVAEFAAAQARVKLLNRRGRV
jgi:hypothetical protein